jgi:hypothetical protein
MLAVVALHRGLQARLHEARRLIELTVSYGEQFKRLGDLPALEPISEAGLEPRYSTVCSRSRTGLPEPAAPNRDGAKRAVMAIFRGEGPAGDIRGGARAPSVVRSTGVAEYAELGRRYTKRSNQAQRSGPASSASRPTTPT